METVPHSQMASYLERWEEQKVQNRLRRQKETRRRSSGVGDEISFISTIEREDRNEERNETLAEAQGDQYADDSFDLPDMELFSPSRLAQDMPKDGEFMDAATFLEKNELSEEFSFSEDVEALAEPHWDQMNASGRPSDFFESKSRNLEHVELSSPRNADEPLSICDDAQDLVEESKKHASMQQEFSQTDRQKGLVLYDRLGRNSGLSGSGTAYSSGYDIHFDSTRLMYTPNSLKYLQEKSRLRGAAENQVDDESNDCSEHHVGEAETEVRRLSSLNDLDISEGPSSEYVATLLKGPEVIKESLREIDAIIDHSIRLTSSVSRKNGHSIELPEEERKFVRDYEHPLESVLPLSRTTDSWGEDISVTQIDDDGCRQSQDSERLSNCTKASRQSMNGIRKCGSQETSELDMLCETSNPSKADFASRSRSQVRIGSTAKNDMVHERRDNVQESEIDKNCTPSKHLSGINLKPFESTNSRATLRPFINQSLAEVAAPQNPFHDEVSRSKDDICSRASDEDCGDIVDSLSMNSDDCRRHRHSRTRVNDEPARTHLTDWKRGMLDWNSVRTQYGENLQCSQSVSWSKRVKSRRGEINIFDSKCKAVCKEPIAANRRLDVPSRRKRYIKKAAIPRRCRRLLCSIGDIMMEQIVFTNGTNSVGRICTSLLPLSPGCQQFTISPAVLELGPKASSAFHVTFDARYAGAVSGIFQFRGIGAESLFHPYEVVIEASVKRRYELEVLDKTTLGGRDEDATTASKRVQELHASSFADRVEVSPTFLRFDRVQTICAKKKADKTQLRLSNNTAHTLTYKIRTLENIRVRPAEGVIEPASEIFVSVLPISQPLSQHCRDTSSFDPSSQAEDWFGSLTVQIGRSYLREVSVVVDRRVIQMLPPFDKIARVRHKLSLQTDSFYYTKRGKRKGLYFHARAVEFGCCNVGESHEVPVYVCNGSNAPMTVLLQDLQDPFSCAYATTTIEPRKFIEVMVTFTPKVIGKVATSLFAYSVTDKAVVTLVARGI